jgi:hypothetical protein
MTHVIYEAKTFDKRSSIKIITDDNTKRAGRLEGELVITATKSGKNTTVHFTPTQNGVYHVVSGCKRYPVFGAISLLDTMNPHPFGYVIQMSRYALIKAFNHMAREVELHYFYDGLCVDVVGIEPRDVPNYPTYKGLDGIIPDAPIELKQYIDAKLKSISVKR